MGRREDLEKAIRDSYDTIRRYEAIQRDSDRPEERKRAGRIINDQRALIRHYLDEYVALCRQLGIAVAKDLAEIAAGLSVAVERFPPEANSNEAPARPPSPRRVLIMGWGMVTLLSLDLFLSLALLWRLASHPTALSFIKAATGLIGLLLQIVGLFVAVKVREMSRRDVLLTLGSRRWLRVGIVVMTLTLLGLTCWPLLSNVASHLPTSTPTPAATSTARRAISLTCLTGRDSIFREE